MRDAHSSPAWTAHDAARVRFRRALTLLLMTLVVPGSAQIVAGRRSVGRIAVRVWLGVIGGAVLLLLLGLIAPSLVFRLLTSGFVLFVLRVGLMGLAVGWALLFIDAWRLGQPLGLMQRQRLAVVGVNGLLCFSTVGTLLFGAHLVGVQRDLLGSMFGSGESVNSTAGRYNVLLLGGDSGEGRLGLRPDSLTLASIDEETGRTILIGLPRNMQNFPFPEGSVMDEQFPTGWDCDDCYLNSVATWARDNEELFSAHPGDPGIEATREAVEGITGLPIHYHALVDMAGFRGLVDAVGGVELTVRQEIPIGGIGEIPKGYIKPGTRTLDGYHTLWFARSRASSDDYSRMARQKCVMAAMADQLDPVTVVMNFEALADASEATVTTDLPASEVGTFAQLALKTRSAPIRTLSFVPPEVNTAAPDIPALHARVEQAIEGEGQPAADQPRKRKRAQEVTGGSVGSLADGYVANDAEDLDAAC